MGTEKYALEEEQVQVVALLSNDHSLPDVADEIDRSYNTVRRWVKDDLVPQGVVDWNGKRGRGSAYRITDDGYDLLEAYETDGTAALEPQEQQNDAETLDANILNGEAKTAVFAYVAEQNETTRDEVYTALDAFDNRGLAATLRFLADDGVVAVTGNGIALTADGEQFYDSVADDLDAPDVARMDPETGEERDNRTIVQDYIAEHGRVTKDELREALDIGNRAIGQNLRHLRNDGTIVETADDTYTVAEMDTGTVQDSPSTPTAATEDGGDETTLLRDKSVEDIMDGRMLDYIERRKAQLEEQVEQQDAETERVHAVRAEKEQMLAEEQDDPLLADETQPAVEQDQAARAENVPAPSPSPSPSSDGTGSERVSELQETFGDMFRDEDGNPYVETIKGDWRHDDGFADRDFTGESSITVPRQRLAALTGLPAETVEAAYIRGMERYEDRSLIEGWDIPEKKDTPDVDLADDMAGYEGFM